MRFAPFSRSFFLSFTLLPVILCTVLSCSHAPQAPAAEESGKVRSRSDDTGQPFGDSPIYREDFSSFSTAGWRFDEGWGVREKEDESFLQGTGHSWAVYQRFLAGDYRLACRIRLDAGALHLVLRLGQKGRYFVNLGPSGTMLNKQLWPDTFIHDLAGSGTPFRRGRWHRVEIVLQGDRITFTVDGEQQWSYSDPEPLESTEFGFETLPDSRAAVDDIAVYGKSTGVMAEWVRTGGPLGGLGYDIRMDPRDPDVLYVTDAFAGIFKSTDGGEHWNPMNEGIRARTGNSGDAIPVFCATIDPHDPETVWAGTQDVRGIYRSDNGGASWSLKVDGIEERQGISFRGITVDPRSSEIVYAAAEISSWNWAGEERLGREFDKTRGVVYKSTDRGESWQPVWRGENLARYILINPDDPQTLYVSTGIFDREAANSDHTRNDPGGEGVLKSSDGGQSWRRVNRGLENLYIGSLFMHPENPEVLLAAAGNNAYHAGSGVYLTQNGGRSWEKVLEGDVITSVEFSSSDPQIAYAGSSHAMYRSSDGGRSWRRTTGREQSWGPPGVEAGFPIDFAVDPREPDRIMVNNYGGGNFLSTDGGRSWSSASNGYTGAQMRDIAVSPENPERVYAAGRSGIFLTTNGGESWRGRCFPPVKATEWNAVALDPSDPRRIIAASNNGNFLALSKDGGRTWRIVSRSSHARTAWRCIVFSPNDPETVFAGSGAYFSAGAFDWNMDARGLYRSGNGGESWNRIRHEIIANANIAALLPPASDSGIMLAAASNNGLLRSGDGGESWQTVTAGLPDSTSALSLARKPDEPGVILLGIFHGGLYRSSDAGAGWESSAAGMNPEATVTDIVFDPHRPEIAYAADYHSGVYRSSDGGRSWRPVNDGLRTKAVRALCLSADGSLLYAATEGEGVFRLELPQEN